MRARRILGIRAREDHRIKILTSRIKTVLKGASNEMYIISAKRP